MRLAGPNVFGPPKDRGDAIAVLRAAVQSGVDHIDTSQYYGPDVVNDLIGVVADANVFIQESKVLTCDIRPGRRPRGPALLDYIAGYRRRAGITPETGTRILTVGDGAARTHAEATVEE